GLVSFLAPGAALVPAAPAPSSPRPVFVPSRSVRPTAQSVLRARHHRRALLVALDDEDLSIVSGHLHAVEHGAGMGPDAVDNTEQRALGGDVRPELRGDLPDLLEDELCRQPGREEVDAEGHPAIGEADVAVLGRNLRGGVAADAGVDGTSVPDDTEAGSNHPARHVAERVPAAPMANADRHDLWHAEREPERQQLPAHSREMSEWLALHVVENQLLRRPQQPVHDLPEAILSLDASLCKFIAHGGAEVDSLEGHGVTAVGSVLSQARNSRPWPRAPLNSALPPSRSAICMDRPEQRATAGNYTRT